MLPPKGLLPNGAEEKGEGTGAVAKVDGAVPNGDGFRVATPTPKGDGVGADDPNADTAEEEGAVPNNDELNALVFPKGDGFVVATVPNGDFVVGAGMKPDDGTPPPAWFEANAPAIPPKPDG